MSASVAIVTDTLADDPAFPALKKHVIASTGLTYYGDRETELAQYVRERMTDLELSTCGTYFDLLQSGPRGETELDTLIGRLTIGETYFFRHRELFEALETVILPQLIERNAQTRRLRVWSAGCSVGAEAYSVAILLHRRFGHLLQGWDINILGTDINRDCLAKAIGGSFDDWAFRSTPTWVREEYFTPAGRGWQIAPHLTSGVSFQYHNLARHHYPALVHNLYAFDLILCRNVMIYCDQEIHRRIASGCWESLVDGGWLLVGHAEMDSELFYRFRRVTSCGAILYQKDVAASEVSTAPSLPNAQKTSGTGAGLPASRGRAQLSTRPRRTLSDSAKACERWPRRSKPARMPLDREKDLGRIRRLTDLGDLQAAAEHCRNVLSTDRLNSDVTFFLALIAEQLGLLDEAQQRLRHVIYLNRHEALAHYHLGLVLLRSGQHLQSRKAFANVLQLLADKPRDQLLPPTDDMTVADLTDLARLQLDTGTKL